MECKPLEEGKKRRTSLDDCEVLKLVSVDKKGVQQMLSSAEDASGEKVGCVWLGVMGRLVLISKLSTGTVGWSSTSRTVGGGDLSFAFFGAFCDSTVWFAMVTKFLVSRVQQGCGCRLLHS